MASPAPQSRPRITVKRKLIEGELQALSIGEDRTANDTVILRRVAAKAFRDPEHLQQCVARTKGFVGRDFPGILAVRQVSEVSGQLVVIMEGTDGRPLSEVSERGDSPEWILAALREAANHLDQLHQQEIVHGDVRPATVFVSGDRRVRLTEFASTHAVLDWTRGNYDAPTGVHLVWTSPAPLPPEVQAGEPASPRSDQYAFAVSMLECLAGRPVPAGADPGAALATLGASPRAKKRLLAAKVPLLRALSADPVNRFSSCSELVSAVEKSLKGSRSAATIGVAAAAVLAAVLFLPSAKWLYAHGVQNDLNEAALARKDKALDVDRKKFSVVLPTAQELTPSLKLTPADPAEASVFQTWEKSHGQRLTNRQADQRSDAVEAFRRQFSATHRLSLNAAGANVPTAFFFNGTRLEATGDPRSALDWTVTAGSRPDNSTGDIDVDATVADDFGKILRRKSFVLTSSTPSFTMNVAAPDGGWSAGQKLTLMVDLRSPAGGAATRATSYQVSVGHNHWKLYGPISINAAKAREAGYAIKSGCTLRSGDVYRVKATGSIQPWTEGTYKNFGFNSRVAIGPSGLTPTTSASVRYLMKYPGVSPQNKNNTDRRNWGALLMRIGGGSWSVPSLHPGDQTSTGSGEVVFSINSLEKRWIGSFGEGNPVSGDADEFWKDEGEFKVSIEVQNTTFPAGTPQNVKSSLTSNL